MNLQMINFFLFLLLYCVAAVFPFWVFLVASLGVVLWRKGYSPILAGFMVDLQFAFIDGYILWYLGGAFVVSLIAELVRPYIYVNRLT